MPPIQNNLTIQNKTILAVENLQTNFYTDSGIVRAVDGVSFSIEQGKTLALVGESGCGKSVTALSIMRLLQEPAGRIKEGNIWFTSEPTDNTLGETQSVNERVNLATVPQEQMQTIRGNKIAMIFQEPMTSLNPVFTIGFQLEEVLLLHQSKLSKIERYEKTIQLLTDVGIPHPERTYRLYPHELSGGMRQRIMIAMALSCDPQLIIADEPTTALDVTIQAQILDLLLDIKEKHKTSILLITHDLGVVAETADMVAVMYAGKIVEHATVNELFANPSHPYTQGLLKSKPQFRSTQERLYSIPGQVPNALSLPKHCYFKERCEQSVDQCSANYPELEYLSQSHSCSCYVAQKNMRNKV